MFTRTPDRLLVIATDRLDKESPRSLSNLIGLTNNDDKDAVKGDKGGNDGNDAKDTTKPCIKCEQYLARDKFNAHCRRKDGLRSICRDCQRKQNKLRYEKQKEQRANPDHPSKECDDCWETVLNEQFYLGWGANGRHNRCKPCEKQHKKDGLNHCHGGCGQRQNAKEHCLRCCFDLTSLPDGMIHCTGCCDTEPPIIRHGKPGTMSMNCVFIARVVRSAKLSTNRRNGKRTKKGLPLHPEIARDFHKRFKAILDKQGWRCATTGVQLVCVSGDAYMLSLDRIDDNLGYIATNVRGVSIHANGRFKLDTVIPILTMSAKDIAKIHTYYSKICKKNGYYAWDNRRAAFAHFRANVLTTTQRKKLAKLACNTLQRTHAKGFTENPDCPQTIDDVYDLIWEKFVEQDGLCAYSDHPLQFDQGAFGLSLERLDVTKGYTKENTALILAVFNTQARNSAQNWTRAKVQAMLAFQRKKRAFIAWRKIVQVAQVVQTTQTTQKDVQISHDGAKRRKLCETTL
jgi:hypothetical protein